MRQQIIMLFIILISMHAVPLTKSEALQKEIPIIIQVEENPHVIKEQIRKEYPTAQIIEVFDKLFLGIALKIRVNDIRDFLQESYIISHYPVKYYKPITITKNNHSLNYPGEIHKTPYTGKGIKVGVIDTGIDYTHPDLVNNFKGGYDLVDLDDNPMETLPAEGPPTNHGTHVAGIVAADGEIKGVASKAEIHAYRALGPGGQGTSIQVIAALEKAVKDGMDIINLSLGNSINGPDFPTTIAVNKAVDLGVAVVIANGNDGPEEWTVGSPATSDKALSIGAVEDPKELPYLYDQLARKVIYLHEITGSLPRNFYKDYELVDIVGSEKRLWKKIVLISSQEDILNLIKQAEDQGAFAVLLTEEDQENIKQFLTEIEVNLPISIISKEDEQWLKSKMNENKYFMSLRYEQKDRSVPHFSSKGPVTGNWKIKPDIIAPGANIVSAIPGGYAALSGTSMAAPHVAGAIALMKEAKPNMTMTQIIQALKTTALPISDEEGNYLSPTTQGTGLIQIERALQTPILIDEPLLSFGKITNYKEELSKPITIENISDEKLKVTFSIPKRQKGISWQLPQTFFLQPKEKMTIPIQLNLLSSLLDEGIHQGWIPLTVDGDQYPLPYLFVNKTDEYPKVMGFTIAEHPIEEDQLDYQFYTADDLLSFQVDLLHPITYFHEKRILNLMDLEKGLHKGSIKEKGIDTQTTYPAIITVVSKEGKMEAFEVYLNF